MCLKYFVNSAIADAKKNVELNRVLHGASRAPLERVFSQDNKRVRYRGLAMNQFAQVPWALFALTWSGYVFWQPHSVQNRTFNTEKNTPNLG